MPLGPDPFQSAACWSIDPARKDISNSVAVPHCGAVSFVSGPRVRLRRTAHSDAIESEWALDFDRKSASAMATVSSDSPDQVFNVSADNCTSLSA